MANVQSVWTTLPMAPPPGPVSDQHIVNPIHLTEENKAEIRTLVNALTKDLPKRPPDPTYDQWAEFKAITRGAFVPHLSTQIYSTSPMLQQIFDEYQRSQKQQLQQIDTMLKKLAVPTPKMNLQAQLDQANLKAFREFARAKRSR